MANQELTMPEEANASLKESTDTREDIKKDIHKAIEKIEEIIHAVEQSEAALNKGIYTLEYYKYKNICNNYDANKLINEYEDMIYGQEYIKKDAVGNKSIFNEYLNNTEMDKDTQSDQIKQIYQLIHEIDDVHSRIGELLQEKDVLANCSEIMNEDDY